MLASSRTASTELCSLISGYRLVAESEGKSKNTIDIVINSVNYLETFLRTQGLSTDVREIGADEIRAFILYLQHKMCFSNHPFSGAQERLLSKHTINCYLRSIRAFWSWLTSDQIVKTNPFAKVKVPRAPTKIIPTFSDIQIKALLSAIDTSSPQGCRNYTMILTFLDTGLRVSELINLRLHDVRLEDGILKVVGKGNKERLVPMGKHVQRLLWRYINFYRAVPVSTKYEQLFLTQDGRPLTKNRLETIMLRYGKRAGIKGVRCSPHTLRHTAAVMFLRNGGGVFSLQRMLGHRSLEMTRHYCELADVDVKRAHQSASPVDNLTLKPILRKATNERSNSQEIQ